MKQKLVPGQKIICLNRKASFNYFFLEILEAGISLKGSEVKSLRDGKGSIADSYAVDNNGELFLINSHIPLYKQSSYNNHDPKSDRKLLLNRKEINKLIGRINSRNSGILMKTIEKTTSGLISPLEACSKYWIDLEETIIRIKITLMVAVYEKIAFRK